MAVKQNTQRMTALHSVQTKTLILAPELHSLKEHLNLAKAFQGKIASLRICYGMFLWKSDLKCLINSICRIVYELVYHRE